MKIAIVCGYGLVLDANLSEYLEAVVNFVKTQQIDNLILSGGYTSKKLNFSEAKVMLDFIKTRKLDLPIILEEESLTTLHNLLFSKKIIGKFEKKIEKIYIFCDEVRYPKIYILSKIIFNNQLIEVTQIGRKEPFISYLMQIPSTIYQVLGAILPAVERRILWNRQNWLNKKDARN